MINRAEPTMGNLDNLSLSEPSDLLTQARAAINAGVEVAHEDVIVAKRTGVSPAIVRAERDLQAALLKAQKAAELLAKAYGAEAMKFEGAQHYLNNDQAKGDNLFQRAAAAFQAIKPQALELAYGLSDMPGEAWDKITKSVNNSLVSAVTSAGAGIEARKASIKAWGDRMSQAFDNTIATIQAVPGQIADAMRAKSHSAKDAALGVLVKVLRWGAKKEDSLRRKVDSVASLGEAALKTGSSVIKGVAQQVRAAGDSFDHHLTEARSRRNP